MRKPLYERRAPHVAAQRAIAEAESVLQAAKDAASTLLQTARDVASARRDVKIRQVESSVSETATLASEVARIAGVVSRNSNRIDESEHINVMHAVLANDVETIKRDIGEIKTGINDLKEKYVTQTEFDVVRKLVFGCVTIILTSVMGALVYMVVHR